MKRLLMAVVAAVVTMQVAAQQNMPRSMTVIADADAFAINAPDVNIKFTPIDQSILLVIYRQTFGNRDCQMMLYIGVKAARFVARGLSVVNIELGKGASAPFGCEIMITLPSRDMEIINHIPFAGGGQCVTYVEPVLKLNWILTGENEKVAGYNCSKATTTFGGRQWSAWFALELPYRLGPWKLGGLPGLILKAEDSKKEYAFTAIGIEKISLPINRYKYVKKKSTKQGWAQMEADIYASPYQYSGAGDDDWIYTKGSDGKSMQLTPSNWSVPYNPIEK